MDPLPFFGPLRHDGDTLNNGNTRIYTLHIFLFQKTSVIEGSRGRVLLTGPWSNTTYNDCIELKSVMR